MLLLRGEPSADGRGEGWRLGKCPALLLCLLRSPSVVSTPIYVDESLVAWGQFWCVCAGLVCGCLALDSRPSQVSPVWVIVWEDVCVSGVKLAFPSGLKAQPSWLVHRRRRPGGDCPFRGVSFELLV